MCVVKHVQFYQQPHMFLLLDHLCQNLLTARQRALIYSSVVKSREGRPICQVRKLPLVLLSIYSIASWSPIHRSLYSIVHMPTPIIIWICASDCTSDSSLSRNCMRSSWKTLETKLSLIQI